MRGLKSRILSATKRTSRLVVVLILLGVMGLTAIPPRPVHIDASHGSGAHMILFWDGGGSAPAGWSYVNDFNSRFIRGESSANYGATGASATHTPTTSSVATNTASAGTLNPGGNGPTGASAAHTHTVSVTVGSANNNPAHRTLRLIRYDGGIPNIIPQGAIALFDNSPGIPSTGWTRQSVFDDRFIRVDATAGTNAGSDVHTHNLDWSALGAASGAAQGNAPVILLPTGQAATTNHTHTAPADTTTATNGTDPCDAAPVDNSCLPPYVQVLIAKADADTPTLSVGLTAMFDDEPGGGWVVRSAPGGPYYQRFLRGGATYNESGSLGSTSHTHTPATSGTSGAASALTGNILSLLNSNPIVNHTHTVTAQFNAANHIPQYFNIIIAEKVNFILEYYAWFEDSNNEDVTDPWSPLDVQENQSIPSLPAQYRPPDLNDELRLRVQILVNNNGLAPNEMQFKLQYKVGTDAVCTTGSWTDVGNFGGAEIWTFADSSVPDGEDLTVSRMTTFTSDVLQIYAKSQAPGTNPRVVNIGERMEYDFHIMNNGAMPATQYSFRIVEDSGILLSQYGPDAVTPICPTLVTKPGTENQMRHGNFFQDGSEQGFSWVD